MTARITSRSFALALDGRAAELLPVPVWHREHREERPYNAEANFAYDPNGNMTRFLSSVYAPTPPASWARQNRLHTFTAGENAEVLDDRMLDRRVFGCGPVG